MRGETGDAVVFLRVDGGEGEGVGEEVRVAHGLDGRWAGRRTGEVEGVKDFLLLGRKEKGMVAFVKWVLAERTYSKS